MGDEGRKLAYEQTMESWDAMLKSLDLIEQSTVEDAGGG